MHLYNEEFVHGRLDRAFDLAWLSCLPSVSVSSVYLVLYVEIFLITSFSLPFSLLSLWDWPLTWKTIIL